MPKLLSAASAALLLLTLLSLDGMGPETAEARYAARRWDGHLAGPPTALSKRQARRMLRRERVRYRHRLARFPYLVRVEIQRTGGGSASRSQVILRFADRPGMAVGKAWADARGAHRAQIGTLRTCRPSRAYAPQGRGCPTSYSGQGWVDLTRAVSHGRRILLTNDPNIAWRAGTVVWFAFARNPGRIPYRSMRRTRYPTFGTGRVSARLYTVAGATPPGPGAPPPTYKGGGGPVGGTPVPTGTPRVIGAAPVPNGTYQLMARHSRKCLDVQGALRRNAANVYQWQCHSGSNQLWTLQHRGGGWYALRARHSGKCLDVAGHSRHNRGNLYQWQCHYQSNQQFRLQPVGGGWYKLVARISGRCVDVEGARNNDGANVFQWSCHGNHNQQWFLIPR